MLTNLAREVMEETGLTMTSEPRVIGAQDIFNTEQNRHIVRVTYICTAEGEPQLSEEHTEYQWLPFDDLKALPNLDRYLKTLLENEEIIKMTS